MTRIFCALLLALFIPIGPLGCGEPPYPADLPRGDAEAEAIGVDGMLAQTLAFNGDVFFQNPQLRTRAANTYPPEQSTLTGVFTFDAACLANGQALHIFNETEGRLATAITVRDASRDPQAQALDLICRTSPVAELNGAIFTLYNREKQVRFFVVGIDAYSHDCAADVQNLGFEKLRYYPRNGAVDLNTADAANIPTYYADMVDATIADDAVCSVR